MKHTLFKLEEFFLDCLRDKKSRTMLVVFPNYTVKCRFTINKSTEELTGKGIDVIETDWFDPQEAKP